MKLVKVATWWRGRGGGEVCGSGREKGWEEGEGRGRPPLQVDRRRKLAGFLGRPVNEIAVGVSE